MVMKKLIFAFAIICLLPMFNACVSDKVQDNQDEEVPQDVPADTIITQAVTGVAVGGAMNSVYLKVGDDTLEFSYPDLSGNDRDAWDISDSLTVKYVETQNGDSVIKVINQSIA